MSISGYFMEKENKIELRDLRNGDWYWIHKAIITLYAKKIGAIGIAVYNCLASLANSSQGCFPSQKYIAKSIGYSRAYINKTIKLLAINGLIRIEKKSRYHFVYYLLKVRCQPEETQMSTIGNPDVNQSDTNNNKLKRNINNIDIESKEKNLIAFKRFLPKSREELLALDLAKALNDLQGLPLYLSYSKKYPEPFLRKVLGEVKEINSKKIKKGRGALFNYLVKKYANKNSGS